MRPLLLLSALVLVACSNGGSTKKGHPSSSVDLGAEAQPDLREPPVAPTVDLSTDATTTDPPSDLATPKSDGPPPGGPAITSIQVAASELWDGDALVITATVVAPVPLAGARLSDGVGNDYGALAQVGSKQVGKTMTWAEIEAAGGLSFTDTLVRTLWVKVTDVNGKQATASVDVSFHCTSGACSHGVCSPETASLGKCTTTLDVATTCTEICARTSQTCKSLGCGGFTGVLVAPDCSGTESGLASLADGSKMTCDSVFLAIATLGLGGVRCCCE